jgi:hypothetical protein
MKALNSLFSLIMVLLLVTGCSILPFNKDARTVIPSNIITSEARTVNGFSGIDMGAFGKVFITQGEQEALTVKGSDNIVPLVKTTVTDGTLKIRMEENVNVTGVNDNNVLTFTITVKDLSNLTVSGASEVEMASLSTSKLAVTMSGAGQVQLGKLAAEQLNITVSGVGNVRIVGETTKAFINIPGAGSVEAGDLKIQTADVNIPGLGGASMWVTDDLTGSISGAGNVSYYGSPRTNTSKTGVGVFKSLGAHAQTYPSFTYEGVTFNIDPSLIKSASGQVIPGKPASADAPYWDIYPQYVSIALDGYPVTKSVYTPQIVVYPVEEYRQISQAASQTLDDLTKFLEEKPTDGSKIPVLPLRNDMQSFNSNVQFLAFQNGRGVRFLTMYAQGPVPVNNASVFYAFQGLTNDGRYFVSVVLPITNPDLPDTPEISGKQADGMADYPSYISKLVILLNQKPGDSFTPDLAILDTLVESLRIGQ